MAYDLTKRLVIGLASSALFDLEESDKIFREKGDKEYRKFQRDKENEPLKEGVAFPFIKRLLSLNVLSPSLNDPLVEVILLSRNDPDTGLRVMKSIEHHQLNMTRAVFLQGSSPLKYIPAFDIELFLSANSFDVIQAIKAGYPAGRVIENNITDDDSKDLELRIAFDFDGVIVDDESESIYQITQNLDDFHDNERTKKNILHNPGPLNKFIRRLAEIQKLEHKKIEQDTNYKPILKTAIVTARSAPSHERAIYTLRDLGIEINEAFFLGGIEKNKVLEIMKPHVFFDDQESHLEKPSQILPSVHIPFGITNKK
ncbi:MULTISPECIES: 5'-nucleotidase [unclassified Gilliamella]|uniref:5'-nucleotidase n=1 Tax=unclassified Gilliamella TaxID=2685620 RepID=UPI00080DF305|nr:5'-nucleotidase [Gilliamella apicola]OCG21969.1 5'-nucleotidase [Gilliamella apicola]OCG22499.1 5'-nucleotidase [Gilliamella apicola]